MKKHKLTIEISGLLLFAIIFIVLACEKYVPPAPVWYQKGDSVSSYNSNSSTTSGSSSSSSSSGGGTTGGSTTGGSTTGGSTTGGSTTGGSTTGGSTTGGSGTSGYICKDGDCIEVTSGATYTNLTSCVSYCNESIKGEIMVWTSQTEYGWPCGSNVMYVTGIPNPNGGSQGIYGGHFTTAPACGATYAYTTKVNEGTYSVGGVVYALSNSGCSNYNAPKQTVVVKAGQCTKVHLK